MEKWVVFGLSYGPGSRSGRSPACSDLSMEMSLARSRAKPLLVRPLVGPGLRYSGPA
jgi:hypothetical protein